MTSLNIEPLLRAFGGQSEDVLRSIGRAASAISGAAASGPRYVHMVKAQDLKNLQLFMSVAMVDVALAEMGVLAVVDQPVDQQHSPDGYSHYLDREKL